MLITWLVCPSMVIWQVRLVDAVLRALGA